MAQVFQCDACKAILPGDSKTNHVELNGLAFEVCDECAEKVKKVLVKEPRKPYARE